MTPAEKSYAAAWISEMWKPTKEYHQTDGERADAWRRQQAVNGAGDERDESLQNVAARVRKGHLTWHNGGATTPHKAAPEAMALATPPRGPNPRTHSEAPVHHALPAPCRQQVTR